MPDSESIPDPNQQAIAPESTSGSIEVGVRLDLQVDRMATGGPAIASAPDGRITLVDGALPSETVQAEVTAVHKNRLEAKCVTVITPSLDRQNPPCHHVGDGCGGCDWQHATPEAQQQMRIDVVNDCLRRIAKVSDVDVQSGTTLAASDYRTTVRAVVSDGKAGFRKRSSHDAISVSSCVTAHPLIEELLVEGNFGDATEVVLRVGANTGERMAVLYPTAAGAQLPEDVKVVGKDEIDGGLQPHYHEEVGGRRLQISAESFFQCRPDGAQLLASEVADMLAEQSGDMLDAYCGVGLFGALAGTGRRIIGVESSRPAAADAVVNYGPHATVVDGRFESWTPLEVGVAVADPARSGLRRRGCDKLAATNAQVIALVSCDPAAMARDVSYLGDHGYQLDKLTVFDLFGHTSHIETVARLVQTKSLN